MSPAAALLARPELEHLTPHDIVTYFRCPHEMELAHLRRAAPTPGTPPAVRTPPGTLPLFRSPLAPPALGPLRFNDGRLDVFDGDTLAYVDEGEAEELPMLFAPEAIRPDPRLHEHGLNLIDHELGLSGRPDWIIRRASGGLVPVEYKATHPFHGLHDTHGRTFDLIQLLLECRLVEAVTGRRPVEGILLYGDVAGDGEHEGWIPLPYTEREEAWVRSAIELVRSDRVRAPVASERTCSSCPPNRDGLCRYAAVRYSSGEPARDRFHSPGP